MSFDAAIFPFAYLHSTVGAIYTSEVLLLPVESRSQGAADLAMVNTHTEPSLFPPYFWSNDPVWP
jgi:hypothetical protein